MWTPARARVNLQLAQGSFGTQTLTSLEGYGGGVSRAGNNHGPRGNEFHADVSARIFPVAGGLMQVGWLVG